MPRRRVRWGIVKEITTSEDLLPKAWDLARLLESGPPLVYAAIKEVVREAENMRFQDALNRVSKRLLPTVDKLVFVRGSVGRCEGFCRKARSGVEGAVASCRGTCRSPGTIRVVLGLHMIASAQHGSQRNPHPHTSGGFRFQTGRASGWGSVSPNPPPRPYL